MLAPGWWEAAYQDTSRTPSPMALSRGDNDPSFYPDGQFGPHRRAFWHPGIGIWQLDDSGLGDKMSLEKFNSRDGANLVAKIISTRYCNDPSAYNVFRDWSGCASDGYYSTKDRIRCQNTVDQLISAGIPAVLSQITQDNSTDRNGGVQVGQCHLTGQANNVPCAFVDPALAQGYTGDPGGNPFGWVSNPDGTIPLAKPFYVFEWINPDNGKLAEWRYWLSTDTGFSRDYAVWREYPKDSRQGGLNWISDTDIAGYLLCNTIDIRGACPISADLFQSKYDGSTLPIGGSTNLSSVLLGSLISSNRGRPVRIELEVRPENMAFTGEMTSYGPYAISDGTRSQCVSGLPVGSYHWQARASEQDGTSGPWVPFSQISSNPDFVVTSSNSCIACSGGTSAKELGKVGGCGETLSVTLSASPRSGVAPLYGVSLTAAVNGSAIGNVNYIFYCNRSDSSISRTPGWVAKFENVPDISKTAASVCDYGGPGTYVVKVIAERGSSVAEARTTITVSQPTVQAPIVTTSAATSITQESATLNMSVNPNGSDASAWFDWGDTSGLGNQTPQQDMGYGASLVPTSFTISNLRCGEIYYFRAHAQNTGDGVTGSTLAFTTSRCGGGGTQAQELLTNGGFEQGSSGWTILSGDWHINPPSPPVTPHSGTHAIYLSTAAGSIGNNLNGRFYSSSLNVPSNAVSGQYSFWLNVITTEPSTAAGVDLLHFTVVDASTFTPIISSWISNQNNTGGSYTFVPFLMDSSLPGRSVRLVFDGTTNQTNPTLFALDDISFTVNVPAGGAPSVSTQESDYVTASSARLSMAVNPNSADTTVWFNFEAGNPSPVAETDHVSIGTGQQSVNFSFGVFDLQCDTVYYYRANASNSYGSQQGLVFSFRTDSCPAQPPAARTNSADSITSTSARLNGAVNPNGFSTNAWFAWGIDTTLGNTTPAQDVGTGNTSMSIAATLNNLQCGTTYYYRAVAQNSGGSDTGALYNFTTASCGPPSNVPPTISVTAPGAGNATADQSFVIAWNDSDPDNNATITLSYSLHSDCSSPVQITGNISEDDPANTYTWNTSALSAGSYYILATISDGVNPTVSSCSSGPVSVSHATSQGQIFKDGFEVGNFTMWSSMLAHPLVGLWQGTIAGYASTLTIAQDTSGQFSAQASIAQAVQPVESLTILSITETSFDALRPADHNAELRLSLTQSGGEQCLAGDYLDNGSTRPISLCKTQ